MADKRGLVTSLLLTQQDSEEQKKKINYNNSGLEVKDLFSILSSKLRKKKGLEKYFKVWVGSATV